MLVDCSAVSQAKLSCDEDRLTVKWHTAVTYKASVSEIPDAMIQKLDDISKKTRLHKILKMTFTNMTPRYVHNTHLFNRVVFLASFSPNFLTYSHFLFFFELYSFVQKLLFTNFHSVAMETGINHFMHSY